MVVSACEVVVVFEMEDEEVAVLGCCTCGCEQCVSCYLCPLDVHKGRPSDEDFSAQVCVSNLIVKEIPTVPWRKRKGLVRRAHDGGKEDGACVWTMRLTSRSQKYPAMKFVMNNRFLHISIDKTPTQETAHPCTAATSAPKHECLQAFSQRAWSCPHRNSMPSQKWQPLAWATRRSRPRWACRSRRRSGGCRGYARRRKWCRTTLGDHVVRRLVCVVFSLHFSSHIWNCATASQTATTRRVMVSGIMGS